MSDFYASSSRFIDADPRALFEIVADPRNHPKIDGSNSVAAPLPGVPTRLYLGASFGMDMHRKVNYRMRNVVTEFVPGRIIAWKPLSGHVWRYTFTPFEGGTLVTEEWDARGVWHRWVLKCTGIARANQRSIERSLERLERISAG